MNKVIIFICIFFILIMSFSFYFIFQDFNTTENPSNDKFDVDKLPTKSEPLATEIPQENLDPKPFERQSGIEKEIKTNIKKSDEVIDNSINTLNFEEKTIHISDDDLYHPIYDKLVVRSRAKAFFLLHDAKGKLLEPKIVNSIRIWRHIRENLWQEDNAVFNHEKSVIECEGYGQQGLEPGRYFVWVNGGGYGALEINFNINKDEEYHANFKMPNFSKIIAVHFVDLEDKNVEYIRSLPTYQSIEKAVPSIKFQSKEVLVLRGAPGENVKKITPTANDSQQATIKAEPFDWVYQTNLGKIYISVFLNQVGEIKYDSKNDGFYYPFIYKSNFEEIDIVKVVIKKPAKINPRTKIISFDANQNNEAVSVNVNNLNQVKKENRLFTIDNKTKGFNYRVKSSKFPLQLEYQNSLGITETIKEDGFVLQHIFPHLEIEDSINIRLVDKKIFRSLWEPITLENGRMIFKEGDFPLQRFEVKFNFTPTIFEMAKDFIEVSSPDNSFALEFSNTNLYFDSYYIEDSNLFNENVSNLNINIMSKISNFRTSTRDPKFTRRFLPKGFIYKTDFESIFQVPFKINTNEVVKSYKKEIEISPLQNVLILRAIDWKVSGLPWVEASLVNYENRRIALEVKKTMNDSMNYDFLKNLTDQDLNSKPNAEMKEQGSKNLKQIFPKKEELDYFLSNGSWYNPHIRSFSDSAGYLILKTDELIPGKYYSLFLWCKSSDELNPDKEIIFKAKEGVTDLGAIRFY